MMTKNTHYRKNLLISTCLSMAFVIAPTQAQTAPQAPVKHDTFEGLVYGLRKILNGETYISSQFNVFGDTVPDFQDGDAHILSLLTQCERDVIGFIAEGRKHPK